MFEHDENWFVQHPEVMHYIQAHEQEKKGEMHKVNPELQKGLSLEFVEAALSIQFDWFSKLPAHEVKTEQYMLLYQAFIQLRQAQAMEEAVNQLIHIRMELRWIREGMQ